MALVETLLTSIASVVCSAPCHLLCFSGLLGTQLYQSFFVTGVAYRSLPRKEFIGFQSRIFPVYFRIQSLLLLLTALTFPPFGPLSLVESRWDWVPFLVSAVPAGLCLMLYGPKTRSIMLERDQPKDINSEQDKLLDGQVAATDRQSVHKRFSRSHAMAIHLNLMCIIATLWHGWRFAAKFQA